MVVSENMGDIVILAVLQGAIRWIVDSYDLYLPLFNVLVNFNAYV